MIKYRILFLVFVCVLNTAVFGQLHYRFPIVNYSPNDYGKENSPQNWSIVQNKQGLIYSGNDNGVLEYDGAGWGFIPVINGKKVFSLALDSSNVIYAGTIGNFGFFRKG